MRSPRFRLARLSTIVVAGAIALSAVVAPAFIPADLGGRAAQAAVDVDIGFFYQELSPYGRWFHDDRYGQVWQPAGVHRGWRPYYDDGHWVYSDDYGWMWVSDYDWGWAPFHYGRWAYSPAVGWFWVPGRQWGPAWVTFRSGPNLIGWAPLPPEAYWEPRRGFRHRDYYRDDDYDRWCFVRTEGFAERRFHRYAYDRRDYPRIIHKTKNVTNITIINNRIVNKSIEVNNIERVTRKKIRRVRVEEADRPTRVRQKGQDVVIYKPAVVGDDGQQTIRKKKRGNAAAQENAATPDLNRVEPSAGSEQPPVRKKKRGNAAAVESGNQMQQPDPGAPEQPVLKKKKKRSNAAAESGNQIQQLDQGAPEQPVLKKKKKRSNAAAETGDQMQQLDQGAPEQPVLKKKKRSNAAADSQRQQFLNRIEPSAGNDGSVRKKRRSQQQFQNQPPQDEQPRRKKRCKGDGCPDNN
jgi:hypothetical protein